MGVKEVVDDTDTSKEVLRKVILEELADIKRRLDKLDKLDDIERRIDDIEERLNKIEKSVRRLNWRVGELEEEVDSLRRRLSGRPIIFDDDKVPVIEPTPALGGIMSCEWDRSGQSLD